MMFFISVDLFFFESLQQELMSEKQHYLSYFTPSKAAPRHPASQYQLTAAHPLLPHIIQQYQYRITNQLLQQKISHPRRDKLIKDSLHETKSHPRPKRRPKTHSRDAPPPSDSPIVRRQKKVQIERLYKTFDDLNSSCNNYNNAYVISLENNRMGKRLINARSRVQDILTKTYYTYQIYNGKIVNRDRFMQVNRTSVKFKTNNQNFGKVNSGIKCFFQQRPKSLHRGAVEHEEDYHKDGSRQAEDDKTPDECDLPHHGYETNNPCILETYGHGDLNLIITQLTITANPPLKPSSILNLQIIQRENDLISIPPNQSYDSNANPPSTPSSSLASAAFPYEYLSSKNNHFGIKFRINYHHHIFVRLLRSQGIQQREMGFFKLDLQPFRSRKVGQFSFTVKKQIRNVEGVAMGRDIFDSEFVGPLQRLKIGEISTKVHVEYQLSYRRFEPLQNGFKDLKFTADETLIQQQE